LKLSIIYIISLVCPSVCRGPENCPLKLEIPKTIQDLELLRPFPCSNCRKRTSSMLQSPSSLCFLFIWQLLSICGNCDQQPEFHVQLPSYPYHWMNVDFLAPFVAGIPASDLQVLLVHSWFFPLIVEHRLALVL